MPETCQGCLQVLERASRGVEDIPEGGDDFRRLGILDDLATEHEAVNGGTWLADPGRYVVEAAASHTPPTTGPLSTRTR